MSSPKTSENPRKLKVFLCHSSGDKPAVRQLYARLLQEDLEPWLDEEDLLPGQNWEREITKAVKTSDVVIVCLSRQAVTEAGFRHKEIKFALDKADELPEDSVYIMPIKLEECSLPERLKHLHAVNYYDERGPDRLIKALRLKAESLNLALEKTEGEATRDEVRQDEAAKSSESQPAITQTEIRKFLIDHYSLEELRDLCFDLEIDYESLAGEGKAGKAREKAEAERREREVAAKQAQLITDLEAEDPQRWQPAAWSLFETRLQNLQHIDAKRAIDLNFITNAQYQLFVDEKREQEEDYIDKYWQPDHWTTLRFPKGLPLEPVAGVRAEDARVYCQWLMEKKGGRLRYRLPLPEECERFAALRTDLGAWCRNVDNDFSLVGLNAELEQTILEQIAGLNGNSAIPGVITLSQSLSLARILCIVESKNNYRKQARACALARVLNLELNLASDHEPIIAADLKITKARPLAFESDLTFNLEALTLDLAQCFELKTVVPLLKKGDYAKAHTSNDPLKKSPNNSTMRKAFMLDDFIKATIAAKANNFLQWRRAYHQFAAHYAEFIYIGSLNQEHWEIEVRQLKEIATDLYWWVKIVMAREDGILPAWEGIRIVQEQV